MPRPEKKNAGRMTRTSTARATSPRSRRGACRIGGKGRGFSKGRSTRGSSRSMPPPASRPRSSESGGSVDLTEGITNPRWGDYQVTSPPAVIGDLVIIGSSIGDNGAAELERGVVRAYDARTGALAAEFRSDRARTAQRRGERVAPITANSGIGNGVRADEQPQSRLLRRPPPRQKRIRNSIVALRADTGAVAWHFQVVHHDLWDYDVATQPVLVEVHGIKAVAVGTKWVTSSSSIAPAANRSLQSRSGRFRKRYRRRRSVGPRSPSQPCRRRSFRIN